ncbi:MAG: hypothetical protein Fur0044_16470 [Anaerolineae bacterium]
MPVIKKLSYPEEALGPVNSTARVVKNQLNRINLYIKSALVAFASTIFLVKETNKQARDITRTLQQFATDKNLTYSKGRLEYWVHGKYQGYELVYHADVQQKKLSLTCTQLSPLSSWNRKYASSKSRELFDKEITIEDINRLFANNLRNPLPGSIKFDASGHKLTYEENDIWVEQTFLLQLFETLSNFADAYADCCATIVAVGGEAVPALEKIAANESHKLCAIAIQLLKAIAQETTKELSHQASSLICPRCMVSYAAHQISLPQGDTVTYFGCRACKQSREILNLKGQIVVVLNRQMVKEQSLEGDTLRVNWLTRRQLFDFDKVEIVQASDEEVERFAVQVGNDTDPVRQPRYKQMQCMVSLNCELSENTLRILRYTFGQMSIKEFITPNS